MVNSRDEKVALEEKKSLTDDLPKRDNLPFWSSFSIQKNIYRYIYKIIYKIKLIYKMIKKVNSF